MNTLADMLIEMNKAKPWNFGRRIDPESPKIGKRESRYARITAFIQERGSATQADIYTYCAGESRVAVKATVAKLVAMGRIRNTARRGRGAIATYVLA